MSSYADALLVPRGQQAGTVDQSLAEKKMEQFLLSHMAQLSVNLMSKSYPESYCDQLLGTKTTYMSSRIQR